MTPHHLVLESATQYIDPRSTLNVSSTIKDEHTNDCLNKLGLCRQIKQLSRPQRKRQRFIILS